MSRMPVLSTDRFMNQNSGMIFSHFVVLDSRIRYILFCASQNLNGSETMHVEQLLIHTGAPAGAGV